MTSYTQLTQSERYQIHALRRAGHTLKLIGRELQRHPATISRELRRNTGPSGYNAQRAQALAEARLMAKAAQRLDCRSWAKVSELIERDWSPEQISLWLKANSGIRVSHEWIYQYVYRDKRAGGNLHRHLRCRKRRRKRYGTYDRRGQINNRVSIDQRPAIVDRRTRLGDWEIDTIVGQGRQGVLLSLTERRSRYVLLAKLPACSADEAAYAAIGLLSPWLGRVRTITADNGREFSGHEDIARALKAEFYFAHPYSPWERGTNENANGLVRQYFPKNRVFTSITQPELDRAMNRLNNRPRKCLAMQTPNQVLCSIKPCVALAS